MEISETSLADKKKAKLDQLAKARVIGKEKKLAKDKRLRELEEKVSKLDDNRLEKPEEKPVTMSDDSDDTEMTSQVITRPSKKIKTDVKPGFMTELFQTSLLAAVPLALTGLAAFFVKNKENSKKESLKESTKNSTKDLMKDSMKDVVSMQPVTTPLQMQQKPELLKEQLPQQQQPVASRRPVGKSGFYL